MNESLIRQRARGLYVPPFKFECGYIFDANGKMVADQDDGGRAQDSPLRIRGWGRIGQLDDAEALQDEVGHLIAELLTRHWHTSVVDQLLRNWLSAWKAGKDETGLVRRTKAILAMTATDHDGQGS